MLELEISCRKKKGTAGIRRKIFPNAAILGVEMDTAGKGLSMSKNGKFYSWKIKSTGSDFFLFLTSCKLPCLEVPSIQFQAKGMLEAETSGGAHCFIGLYSLNPSIFFFSLL